ncbi:alpha/beta hydrolase [Aquabacterium sp. A7-Y]|uniref:alpha/beta fold hydrolase n=1 Tax=Aquabacterium sp. A7-Y TaxID=1349605 RepID=UPI00223E1CE2|nr:alpha/beta hydrolase [Aquabacterium sp. A7-Y]MCW7539751.1 alpha/beta hydrolase [Aquabacterium sp. A7-Y]
MFFDTFTLETVALGEVRLRVRHGGHGPPVLLLHGHPRTHATWHRVAPLLAARFTVICPDLRGYGRSSKPAPGPGHAAYAKRAMAADMQALMDTLGHDRYAVVGHDRGAYVAFRLAMDQPGRVSRLAVLDAVPIGDALARCDAHFATRWWHWFFYAQPERPEQAILADPLAWYRAAEQAAQMDTPAYADFVEAIRDPATVSAMLADYRAGLGVDRAHDDADRAAGRRLACPVLALWAGRDDLAELHGDVLAVWRRWADEVQGGSLDCGHHLAEERPQELAEALLAFLDPGAAPPPARP